MQKKFQRNLIALAVASALGGTSTLASAAGFALIEQSASGMGNANSLIFLAHFPLLVEMETTELAKHRNFNLA